MVSNVAVKRIFIGEFWNSDLVIVVICNVFDITVNIEQLAVSGISSF
jgi:hypothetical protein